MRSYFERFSGRQEYRLASSILLVGSIAFPLVLAFAWGWGFLPFVIGLPFYIALVVLTYHRLQDASLSSGWLILMILAFNIGPSWDIGGMHLYPSALVNLVPVILGWFAPTKDAHSTIAAGPGTD